MSKHWTAHLRLSSEQSSGEVADQLENLHHAASAELKELTATSAQNWKDGANAAEAAAATTLRIFVGMSICAALLAFWLVLEIRRRITRPIASITAALAALASGDTQVRVPEAGRDDEIGDAVHIIDGGTVETWPVTARGKVV